jgi:hypothetical protein
MCPDSGDMVFIRSISTFQKKMAVTGIPREFCRNPMCHFIYEFEKISFSES